MTESAISGPSNGPAAPPQSYPGPGGSWFDWPYLAALVRRNWWLIALLIGGALAVAVAATLLTRPVYTATATIQVNETVPSVVGEQDAETEANTWDYDRFAQTQVDILKSRALAERVANALSLSGDEGFLRGMGVDPAAMPTVPAMRQTIVHDLLQRNIAVTAPRGTRVIPIAFESGDPAVAARVINTYAEQLIEANLQRKYDSSAYARRFLSQQLGEAKDKLEMSERDLNAYARRQGLVRLGDPAQLGEGGNAAGSAGNISLTNASLAQVNQAALAARASRVVAEGRWNAISGAPLFSPAAVREDPTVAALMQRMAVLQGELAEERARRLDAHPAVQAKQAELRQIDSQLTRAANDVRRSIRSDYDAALAAERQLAGQVETLKGATLAEQDRSVQYALLAREADTNRQLYDELLQRYKQLNAGAGVATSNIAIIDRARVPAVPSAPSLMRNLALALLLGSALAALALYARNELDLSVRVPEDVESRLGLPLLGVVPLAKGAGGVETALADPQSPLSESYASLRASLLYATADGLPRTLLVTSSAPHEGKSTTARALADGFARGGKRVVLVDADIRRPSLHRAAGADNAVGLTTVLTGQAPLAEALLAGADNAPATLPAGPPSPAPGELLASPRMQQVIDSLADSFDLVVIDSPPVLGLADAPTLAVLVDGVVFVVQAGKAHRGALRTALKRLRALRPNLLGAVLTRFDPTAGGNAYSSYYGNESYAYRNAAG